MVLLITLLKIAVVLFVVLTAVAYLVYAERKISAWIQNRIGPNRVGWHGLLQPLADVLKLLLKEDIVPAMANRKLHLLAPVISITVALSTLAVIPFGGMIDVFGVPTSLAIAPNVNVGLLYILAFSSVGVYGITLAGWASNSKYSLLGGLRSAAQMISYELSMGLSIIGVLMLSGSLDLGIIVSKQSGMWNIIRQPIGFIIFLVAAFAETNRAPFDLPEAEPELVGGYHTEYSSMKFALFFLAEYANMITASAFITTLYFGGYHVPFVDLTRMAPWVGVLLQIGSFVLKVCAMLFFFIWVRWSLPRFRYDQLMNLGWKVMIPLALANIVVTGAVMLLLQ